MTKKEKNYLLKTKRLGIRLLDETEIKHLENLAGDKALREALPKHLREGDRLDARVFNFIMQYRNKGLPCFSIYEAATGHFTGAAGFSPIESGEIEVGYVFYQKYWGNGYATEALDALLKWAKKNITAEYIIAFTVTEHIAAQRVLDKCGMSHYKTDVVDGVECRFYRVKNK